MVDSEQDLLFTLQCLCKRSARKQFRRDIKDSWDNKCAYCGSGEAYTLDHIIAQSKGGPTRRHNLVCCCGDCNLRKSDEDAFLWFRQQKFFSEEKEVKILSWYYTNSLVVWHVIIHAFASSSSRLTLGGCADRSEESDWVELETESGSTYCSR